MRPGDVQVGPQRVPALAYLVALVRLLAMERVAVLVGKNRHRREPELVDGPKGPDRDLSTVGDQNFAHATERSLAGRGPNYGPGATW